MITFDGIEWDYNNLQGIGYDSETLLEPYATWFYQITSALNFESETINLGLTDDDKYASIYRSLMTQWGDWSVQTNTSKVVIGISGGKDSTVIAALAARLYGAENVLGVLMPNGEQKDIEDSLYDLVSPREMTAYSYYSL